MFASERASEGVGRHRIARRRRRAALAFAVCARRPIRSGARPANPMARRLIPQTLFEVVVDDANEAILSAAAAISCTVRIIPVISKPITSVAGH